MINTTKSLILLAGYSSLILFSFYYFFKNKNKFLSFLLLLCVCVSFALNVFSLLYYLVNNDVSVFYFTVKSHTSIYASLWHEDILMGLALNFLYVLFWVIGFIFILRHYKVKVARTPVTSIEEYFAFPLLIFGIISWIWFASSDFGYGYSQQLYAESGDDAGFYGVAGAFRSLLGPVAAAYLVFGFRRSEHSRSNTFFVNKNFQTMMWLILFSLVIVGTAVKVQRGAILGPILLAIFVLLLMGKTKKAIFALVLGGVCVIVMSPVLDFVRSSPTRGDTSWSNFSEAFYSEKRLGESRGINLTTFLNEAAKKSVLPVSSATMYRYTEDSGFVGFAAYPSIVTFLIPRLLYPDKPYPLSVDGTPWGRANFIVGSRLGNPGVTNWNAGSGVMYWQFGWFGVVLGGLLVGAIWGWLAKKALCGRSFFMLVLFFAMPGWGLFLFESLDFLLLRLLSFLRVIGPFWILSSIWLGTVYRPRLSNHSFGRGMQAS